MDADETDLADRRARALSSALRMRILRYCLHVARTNREIAAEFALNPGTSLHHVRTLVDTGFLVAEGSRTGARGAKERPYRATGRSWRTEVPGISAVLVQAFLDDIDGIPPDDIHSWRMGFLMDDAGLAEFGGELTALIERFRAREPGPGARPVSMFAALHPERSRAAAPEDQSPTRAATSPG